MKPHVQTSAAETTCPLPGLWFPCSDHVLACAALLDDRAHRAPWQRSAAVGAWSRISEGVGDL